MLVMYNFIALHKNLKLMLNLKKLLIIHNSIIPVIINTKL